MSAGPHWLQRLRCWWQLEQLHARSAQLGQLAVQLEQEIDQLEQDIAQRLAELESVYRAAHDTDARIVAARQPGQAPQFLSWGL